jgi:hypothetical protein
VRRGLKLAPPTAGCPAAAPAMRCERAEKVDAVMVDANSPPVRYGTIATGFARANQNGPACRRRLKGRERLPHTLPTAHAAYRARGATAHATAHAGITRVRPPHAHSHGRTTCRHSPTAHARSLPCPHAHALTNGAARVFADGCRRVSTAPRAANCNASNLQPENVLLDHEGNTRICDLGLARVQVGRWVGRQVGG